ncbi:MAG: polyisoprenoid-binding protein [Flavobacteriales bacterium]|nr:polyisoprenoid-binding protein [Flavobacteriales bacterium]
MKKILISVAAGVLICAGTSIAQVAKKWGVDKSHASVTFSIDHFFSEVPGKFKQFDGDIFFDPANLSGSKASFEIMVASISTDEKDRDDHLQSSDFFDATNNPMIVFKSSHIVKASDKLYNIHGELSMRGVTKSVVLPMKIKGRMDNPWKEGYEILGISISTTLNRSDYGVGTGSWAATAVVSDEVEVKISMELDAPIDPTL